MAVDGLIIPRSYNDYFSRSDPNAIRQLVAQFTDSALSTTSENPVQNKVVKAALDEINAVIPAGASSSDKLALESEITAIEAKIPTQASAQNQLADKGFVNSSIGTNTANYISDNGEPFASVAALEAYSGTVTNNDYAFVTGTDAAGNTYYDRYKATVSGSSVTWAKEYRLNNSSFTAAQWASIQSGITAEKVAQYDALGKPASLVYERARWLRFSAVNKKGVVIAAGTTIIVGAHVFTAETDTAFDLSEDITTAGKDYFIYLNWADGDVWTLTASTTKSADTATSRYIGRCHTLCVTAGGSLTAKIPASPSSGIVAGNTVLVKSYKADEDADFYNFYNKTVQSVSAGSYYDVITVAHPLAGYAAGDILPESIFCLSWKPKTLHEDGMVYDRDTDACIDIYLQSGTGLNTKSEYNKTHTVSRQQWNHQEDMRQVGKKLLSDYEFTSAAIGSNETTNIYGSADVTTVGGHSDTASRRMISAIGCEEMAGYLWQWLDEVIGKSDENSWTTTDGRGQFGQEYWQPRALLAGGDWNRASRCGSRCRYADRSRSNVIAYIGGRGSSRVIRGL